MSDLTALMLENYRAGHSPVAPRPTLFGQGVGVELLFGNRHQQLPVTLLLRLKSGQIVETKARCLE